MSVMKVSGLDDLWTLESNMQKWTLAFCDDGIATHCLLTNQRWPQEAGLERLS